MKVFIWEQLSEVSESYHSNGGLVVIAETLERALEVGTEHGIKFLKDETVPDFECDSNCREEKCFVFPDAGCC